MKKLIVTLLLLVLPLSVMAMDAVTNAELDGVAGQAGVTIAFGGTATTRIDFSRLGWGDPDGFTATCGNLAGWLIIDGDIIIDQIIGCGQSLSIDIGTTAAACFLPPCSIPIGAGVTFLALGLPVTTLSITVPDTLTIGLTPSSTTTLTFSNTLGILNLANLDISAGTPTQLYIWAH